MVASSLELHCVSLAWTIIAAREFESAAHLEHDSLEGQAARRRVGEDACRLRSSWLRKCQMWASAQITAAQILLGNFQGKSLGCGEIRFRIKDLGEKLESSPGHSFQ